MKFKRDDTRKVKAMVELTPLIDVVFQLLLFFMVTSSFVTQTAIPIEMSESEGGVRVEKRNVTITLAFGAEGPDSEGRITYREGDDQELEITDWDDLRQRLADLKERDDEASVLIVPDRRVATERLIRVLGMANAVGIQHYGIGAQEEPESL